MFVCEDGHEQIIHENITCPLCELKEEHKSLEDELDECQASIYELSEIITELEQKIEELQK